MPKLKVIKNISQGNSNFKLNSKKIKNCEDKTRADERPIVEPIIMAVSISPKLS